MGLVIALAAFIAVAALAGLVALACLTVGGVDPVNEDFEGGRE
jgi:hypothetical protein